MPAPQQQQPKLAPVILAPFLIAVSICVLVTAVRLYGELQGWAPAIFNTEFGGGASPLSITWLVIPFGFWFGRRCTAGGSPPRSIAKALALPLLGIALWIGAFYGTFAWFGAPETLSMQQWVWAGLTIYSASLFLGFLTFAAWPRIWLVLFPFGYLSRLPVLLIQFYAIDKDWDVHYTKLPDYVPEELRLAGLAAAQSMVWGLGWTPLVGGFFAALGAASVGSDRLRADSGAPRDSGDSRDS